MSSVFDVCANPNSIKCKLQNLHKNSQHYTIIYIITLFTLYIIGLIYTFYKYKNHAASYSIRIKYKKHKPTKRHRRKPELTKIEEEGNIQLKVMDDTRTQRNNNMPTTSHTQIIAEIY